MSASNEDQIRQRAYEFWVVDGRPDSKHTEHWHRAVRDVGENGSEVPPPPSIASHPRTRPAPL